MGDGGRSDVPVGIAGDDVPLDGELPLPPATTASASGVQVPNGKRNSVGVAGMRDRASGACRAQARLPSAWRVSA
jgi:hypothetical protein